MAAWITGDTHGKVLERLKEMPLTKGDSVIILGDVGLNFWLNEIDTIKKQTVEQYLDELGAVLYCIRGNHEERPERLNYLQYYNVGIQGFIYKQPEYPNIQYFIDGETYVIDGYKTLVAGGAYSIDKDYRIANYMQSNGWCGWFADEQLSKEEMEQISKRVQGQTYDVVLSHTCPIEWRPTTALLPFVSGADTTMELWMQELKDNFTWGVWLCGHYHQNCLLRPHVEVYYHRFDKLDNIIHRWDLFDLAGTLEECGLPKSQEFYMS